YVLSPWSRGGWVDSQVYDHTSVLRSRESPRAQARSYNSTETKRPQRALAPQIS
ncbi:alkaline phosphatase family protein, partial [Xanthomonas campestris pv. campestris]